MRLFQTRRNEIFIIKDKNRNIYLYCRQAVQGCKASEYIATPSIQWIMIQNKFSFFFKIIISCLDWDALSTPYSKAMSLPQYIILMKGNWQNKFTWYEFICLWECIIIWLFWKCDNSLLRKNVLEDIQSQNDKQLRHGYTAVFLCCCIKRKMKLCKHTENIRMCLKYQLLMKAKCCRRDGILILLMPLCSSGTIILADYTTIPIPCLYHIQF